MRSFRHFRQILFFGITMTLFLCAPTGFAAEQPAVSYALRELDFDVCDPVRLQAVIMEKDQNKETLIVAEKEIRLMDVSSAGSRHITALLDYEGKVESIAAFHKGDLVLVEGFSHPDGFVAASKIQKIHAVTETRKTKRIGVRPEKSNYQP
jgi:hypothetical protein